MRGAVHFASLAATLALALPAQEHDPGPVPGRVLTLQNLAPFPRREVAAVVVPFVRGAVPDLPELHALGRPTVWQPFGARWPDGSLRQALCLFEAEVGALAETSVTLAKGPGPELPTGELAMPAAALEFFVRRGERTDRAVPERIEDLENNALRRVELRRARIGSTGLVAELIVTVGRGQPHAYVDAALFFSDPTTAAMQVKVDEVAIRSRGMALVFRHAQRFGMRQKMTDDGSRVVLLDKQTIGDGQGIRRCGALVPPLSGVLADDATSKAACVAPLLGATDWRSSAAFGAFGQVPPLPPWLRGPALRNHLAARHRRFVESGRHRGDPFAAAPLLQARSAGQTGDQYDFGVVKLSLVAGSGIPSMLLEAEASVLQAACRPVHFRGADGAPIEPATHPEWIVWAGRTHWHKGQSPDRLGKPHPEPPFESHGWTGKDRQHWSSNHLGAFALLTGAHWARSELRNEARLYLSGQTIDPGKATSGSGAPRGAGRTELAASWMYLATGDERLLERMNARLDKVYYPQWVGRELADDRVRPHGVASPDPRMLEGKVEYWTPWQEGIAAVGFGAAFAVTQNPRARELAEEIACNNARHGWLLTERECIVATALRWQDGEPLTAEDHRDPAAALWSYGTAFSEWAIGAVEIARVTAVARGDVELAKRCAEIQRRVRSGRQRPGTDSPAAGGVDRLAEWDAVRWQAK